MKKFIGLMKEFINTTHKFLSVYTNRTFSTIYFFASLYTIQILDWVFFVANDYKDRSKIFTVDRDDIPAKNSAYPEAIPEGII